MTETIFEKPRSILFVCLTLFLLTICVYLPALQCGFLYFDENFFVLSNPHVNTGLTWANISWAFYNQDYSNWFPLTWLLHMLDVQIYGLNPWGHHLTNVLFHAFNTVLLFLVFRKMTGANWRSLAVAGLFSLHPLHVASVASISEHKDVLSTMFWLLAMLAYARFAEESQKQNGQSKLFYALTLLLFILGLMSKLMLMTLPFVFLLLDYWPLKRWEKNKWQLILEKIPFIALTVIVGTISYISQQKRDWFQQIGNLSFDDRLGNALISYVRYLGKFFWPENLCAYYPFAGPWPTTEVFAATLFLICVTALALTQRRQKPWFLMGWLWYLGTFLPVIGLVQLGAQSIADRFTYVPLIGMYLLLVWGLYELTKNWRHRVVILSTVAVIIFASCALLTIHEIGYWKNDVTVWNRAIAVTKGNFMAHNNLGIVLQPTQPDAAIIEFEKALQITPNFSGAQMNLAGLFLARGQYDDAIMHYRKSLEIEPHFAQAEHGLGIALSDKSQPNEAIVYLQKAVEDDSGNSSYQNNLGVTLSKVGRLDEAIAHIQKAIELNSNNSIFQNDLGIVFMKKGQPDEAEKCFQKAVELNPLDAKAQYDLGAALLNEGKVNESIPRFQEALKLKPDFTFARTNLDLALQMKAQMTPTNQMSK